jgi:transcription antitermination factor NusG
MSVLKHLKTLQHVSIFSDHLQGTRRFLVKVTEFKVFKILKVIYGDAAVCVVQTTFGTTGVVGRQPYAPQKKSLVLIFTG